MFVLEANSRLKRLIDSCRSIIGSGTDVAFLGFEYDSSAAAFMEITLQHAEAFHAIASGGESLYFAAASCARSAMEAAATVAWICAPNEKVEKEGRWLGYYDSMATFHTNQAEALQDIDPEISSAVESFRSVQTNIRNRTINGKRIPIVAKPSFRQLLNSIGHGEHYASYRELCEIVHIGPEMVHRFVEPMTFSNGISGFRISPRKFGGEWTVPFLVIGWSVALSVNTALIELGDTPTKLVPIHEAQKQLTDCIRTRKDTP
ncbi:MAG: DUF5677 domain-containing protein [Verrucomicrobia bacterium]|nr:DUF5677 domain-containing protein [Verrucomicrobiota bacterium]